MKKYQNGFIIPLIIIMVAIIAVGGGVYVYQENKKTEPSILPSNEIKQPNQGELNNIQALKQGIVVTSLTPNELVKLPITIEGYLDGQGWTANEGEIGVVEVFDANGKSISNQEIIRTTSDWLKFPTYFKALVGDREMMSYIKTDSGFVKITGNGAKDGELVKSVSIPVKFSVTSPPTSSTLPKNSEPPLSVKQPVTLDEKLTIPNYVSVFLATSMVNNERVPVLVLSAVASGGCGSASNLETKNYLNGNISLIEINGYKFTKSPVGNTCTTVVVEARAKVILDLDWLKKSGDKEIVFKLNGVDNKYVISYNNYNLILKGVKARNVITNQPGTNPAQSPVTLEMILYPTNVAIMYLAGSVSSEKDYRPALRKFAEKKDFTPADQVYPGLEQNEKNQFYVVLNNHAMPRADYGEALGDLPDEGVGVYLKQVFNSADYYGY